MGSLMNPNPQQRQIILSGLDVTLSSQEARLRGPPAVAAYALPLRFVQHLQHDAALRVYEDSLAKERLAKAKGEHIINSRTTMAAAYTHGVAPSTLEGLQPVNLAAVARRVNEIQAGRVLFAHVTRRAHRSVGTTIFIEEPVGDGIELVLYNYVMDDEDPQVVLLVLPVGTHLAVLQPYMRHTRDDPVQGRLILRCDNPQAILLFEDRRSWLEARIISVRANSGQQGPGESKDTSAAAVAEPQQQPAAARALCEAANAEFVGGRDAAAVRLYTRALMGLEQQLPGPDAAAAGGPSPGGYDLELHVRLLANRAAALLRQERWDAALVDAEQALAVLSPAGTAPCWSTEGSAAAAALEALRAKCQYRRALALLLLQRPEEALQAAAPRPSAAAAATGADAVLGELRRDAECMLVEQRDGRYDLLAMEAEAAKAATAATRVGTGTGNLAPVLSHRRHADFTHPSIGESDSGGAKGRSMVSCAALPAGSLIMAARAFIMVQGSQVMLYSSRDGTADTGSQALILPQVVRLLVKHPERGPALYSLSGGPGFEGGIGGDTTRVDVPRITRILANNWFGTLTEVDELRQVLRAQQASECSVKQATDRNGTGLWIRPSLFNHSCTPNCTFSVVGDFMLVSTTRPTAAGEELCISYLDLFASFEARAKTLRGWNGNRGFECNCPRCSVCRSCPDVAALEQEVEEAYHKGVELLAKEHLAYAAVLKSVMSKTKRQAVHAKLGLLPLSCQAALLRLLEVEGCAAMEARRGGEALALFQRMVAIEDGVKGTCFRRISSFRTHVRLCAAALLAGKAEVAAAAMCAIVGGCCPPGGVLSRGELLTLSERYDFGLREQMHRLVDAAVSNKSHLA